LLDIDSDALGIPETDYKSVVKTSSPEFQKICSNLTTWGDTVVIKTSKDDVTFSVSGEIGSGNIKLKPHAADDEEGGTAIDLTEAVTLTFALRKLVAFTKATSLSSSVTISLSPDIPLAVEYTIEQMGYIRYYLAPKIEDDQA